MNTAKCKGSQMYSSRARFSDCRDHIRDRRMKKEREKTWEGTIRTRKDGVEICLGKEKDVSPKVSGYTGTRSDSGGLHWPEVIPINHFHPFGSGVGSVPHKQCS